MRDLDKVHVEKVLVSRLDFVDRVGTPVQDFEQ